MQQTEITPTTETKRRRFAAVLAAGLCFVFCLRASTIAKDVLSARSDHAKAPQAPNKSPITDDNATVPPSEFALVNPADGVQMVGRAGPPIPVGSPGSNALPLSITGTATKLLAPGLSSPLRLEVTNPNALAIVLDTLDVSFVGTPSCDGPTNFETTRLLAEKLTVNPGRNQIEHDVAPIISMRNLPLSQDACKGAKIRLEFAGVAHQ